MAESVSTNQFKNGMAIEIDGDSHTEPDQAAYDAGRTEWLQERGYEVIRFEALQADQGLQSVVEAIQRACEARIREL